MPFLAEDVVRTGEQYLQRLPKMRDELGFRLLVDTREKAEVKERFSQYAEQVALPAGDIWILLNGRLVYVFERKRLSDFSSSISDRTKKQLWAIKQLPIARERIWYLLEKDPSGTTKRWLKPRSALVGAQVNLLARDGIGTTRTDGLLDTVYYVLKLCLSIAKHAAWHLDECVGRFPVIDPTTFDPETTGYDQLAHRRCSAGAGTRADEFVEAKLAHVCKKAVIDQRSCFVAQLAQVPGVTAKRARQVVGLYPSWIELVAAVASETKEGVHTRIAELVDDEELQQSSKKRRRRFGPALATKLLDLNGL
jgi:ERCC4-type nuclease